MNLVKRAGCLAALLILFGVGSALAQQLVVGRDYTLINPPQPTTSGNKIEVLEFFWYGCIHCYHLESPLKAWLKRKPADVEFRYVPAAFNSSWLPLARAFYALEAMVVVKDDGSKSLRKVRVILVEDKSKNKVFYSVMDKKQK